MITLLPCNLCKEFYILLPCNHANSYPYLRHFFIFVWDHKNIVKNVLYLDIKYPSVSHKGQTYIKHKVNWPTNISIISVLAIFSYRLQILHGCLLDWPNKLWINMKFRNYERIVIFKKYIFIFFTIFMGKFIKLKKTKFGLRYRSSVVKRGSVS